jgi:hypothetical protein
MKSVFYEWLFLLTQHLEQGIEMLELFRQEGSMQPEYFAHQRRIVETLRSDLTYVITGLLHRKELELSIGLADKPNSSKGNERKEKTAKMP